MTSPELKAELHGYLRGARETLVRELDGLSEYDIRRLLTPTGTNLLGLVKHSTATHVGYFGEVFGRTGDTPAGRLSADAERNLEFWATPHETRQHIVNSYQRAWELSDTTILQLAPDAIGQVPWWPEDEWRRLWNGDDCAMCVDAPLATNPFGERSSTSPTFPDASLRRMSNSGPRFTDG